MHILFEANHNDDECKSPISNGLKRYFAEQIKNLYERFAAQMDLTSLESIIVPEHFKERVALFEKEKNAPENNLNDEILGVYSIVVSYQDEGKLSRALFIHKSFACFLIDDETLKVNGNSLYAKALAVNIVHHQFAYIHEYAITDHIRNKPTGIAEGDHVGNFFLSDAENVFNEYYASRLSASTHICTNEEIDCIVKQVRYIAGVAPVVIDQFQAKGNADELSAKMHHMILTLFKYAAGNHGNVYAMDTDKDREFTIKQVEAALSGTFFEPIWLDLELQLNHLYDTFSGWTSLQPLVSLCKIILRCWNSLGVSLKTLPDGIQYTVM